jgi:hypothetical protein
MAAPILLLSALSGAASGPISGFEHWRGHEKRCRHDQAGERREQQCQAVDPFGPGEIRVAVGGDVTG